MLLKYLNDFSISRNLLDDLAFTRKEVRWIITLDEAGNLIGEGPVETEGGKNQGKAFECPRILGSKVAGGVAEFLVDSITAVFALDTNLEELGKKEEKKREKRQENNRKKYDNFWAQIERAQQQTFNSLLKSLLTFKSKIAGKEPSFWDCKNNCVTAIFFLNLKATYVAPLLVKSTVPYYSSMYN